MQTFQMELEPELEKAVRRYRHPLTAELEDALAYTLLAGGKRIRPFVIDIWADPQEKRKNRDVILSLGVVAELIHSSSLILDDLPSMDDATLRRGRKCCHQQYGVDIAILAANAQLMMAFEILGEMDQARGDLDATARFARAIGMDGMIAGQYVDLHIHSGQKNLKNLEFIHSHKTGILFEVCASIGVAVRKGNPGQLEIARIYARNLGLAFQIKDDLLDATGQAEEMGKDAQKDRGKATFAASLGLKESEEIMQRLLDTAREAAERARPSSPYMLQLCDYVGSRRK